MANLGNLEIENARILFRNFSGKESRYNAKGSRNFCVVIDDEKMANRLAKDGWRVKTLAPRDPDDDPTYYIPVSLRFDVYPPKVMMITNSNKVFLDEGTINSLDNADIKNIDLVIRPYSWENMTGDKGVKAYLKAMYVTIQEDSFASKYRSDPVDFDDDDDEEPF